MSGDDDNICIAVHRPHGDTNGDAIARLRYGCERPLAVIHAIACLRYGCDRIYAVMNAIARFWWVRSPNVGARHQQIMV